LRTQYIQ